MILPGLGNSGPQHWQTLWERAEPSFTRVEQTEWDRPHCDDWVATLDRAVAGAGPRTVLVAHSLACLLVAQWAHVTKHSIRGALLVATPDPDGITFPDDAVGFAPVPLERLAFPSIVVASTDDPYSSIGFARDCARCWGSRYVELQAAGHINADSGLGRWEPGLEMLRSLIDAPARPDCGR